MSPEQARTTFEQAFPDSELWIRFNSGGWVSVDGLTNAEQLRLIADLAEKVVR